MGDDFLDANVPIAAGFPSQQAAQAAHLYVQVVKQFGKGANISFTGHSLGGGLAQLMGLYFDRKAHAFAPAL